MYFCCKHNKNLHLLLWSFIHETKPYNQPKVVTQKAPEAELLAKKLSWKLFPQCGMRRTQSLSLSATDTV